MLVRVLAGRYAGEVRFYSPRAAQGAIAAGHARAVADEVSDARREPDAKDSPRATSAGAVRRPRRR